MLGAFTWVRPAPGQVPSAARPLEITAEEAQQKENLVTVPEGFEFSLFAGPPEVNYPTAITAAPNGHLFVAVDKNGSLGTDLGRGSILKVFDADGDGQGDRYTVFVDSVDSPRGLVYDGERLYVMHPPTLTVYTDTDGDGVSDRSRDLVKGLGYGLDFRGADHTTNGVQMGIDGWLYIAVGDYGFHDAVGTDERHIQNRSGGIVRVRPDGSELEVYATGLRNPYDVALDPYLNGFERGNTNDGYGWDVRLQHIVPQAEYGYPDLFKHFSDEVMPALADYGGGSGAGALYVDSPHLPDSLGRTLYTADWGRGVVYRHGLTASGATFEATQQVFTRLPQPTDLTIDAASNLYLSSWMGGGFTYSGEDVGFVAQLRPVNAPSAGSPDVREVGTDRLLELLASAHSRTRLHAQRELLRRDPGGEVASQLAQMARGDEPLDVRVAALFTLKQLEGADSHSVLRKLVHDPALKAFVLRALADRKSEAANVSPELFVDALDDEDPSVRLQALNGLVRLDAREEADEMMSLATDPDRTVAHVAVQSLIELEAVESALEAFRNGSPGLISGAARVLKKLHTPAAVKGLIAVHEATVDPYVRQQTLTTLARLYHREVEWERGDWWGTTPSPRGPYYAPVEWEQSDQIRPVLRNALAEAEGFEYRKRVHLIERNRAVPDASTGLLLAAAGTSDSLKAEAIQTLVGDPTVTDSMSASLEQLAARSPALRDATIDLLIAQPDLPASSAGLLRAAALDESRDPAVRGQVLGALGEISGDEGRSPAIDVYAQLVESLPHPDAVEGAIRDYVGEGQRARALDHFVDLADTGSRAEKRLAYAILLQLAENDWMEEAATTAQQTVDRGWNAPERTAPLLWAIGFTEAEGYAEQIRRHLGDGTASDVREAARYAADRLGLSTPSD